MRNTIRAKVAIVGDSTVGKTALTKCFLSDGRDYPKNYEMTFGVDLSVKTVPIPDTSDVVELYLYDSSGRSIYEDILQKYWNSPNMFVVVCDVTSSSSLASVPKWTELARRWEQGRADREFPAPGVLVANKTDLEARRVVSAAEAKEVASALNLQFVECSAKENKGVTMPFEWVALEWHRLFMDKISSFHRIS